METTPGGMTTLTGVLAVLKERGYDTEFRLLEDGRIQSMADEHCIYAAGSLKIIRTYRFEGDSNPSDSAVLYVLEHNSNGDIGYIINAYGAYSDYEGDVFDEFIRKLPVEERDFE